ncbi:MAG: YihY/virulence factor BrkB family protein [Acidimicrobiia bacterium]|nr:YihY/virulence factor BrkB family protein [Acidimicrobiia bacterium]
MNRLDEGLARLDRFQQRHAVIAFPHAVLKRYGEDRGSWLGATISYYGFFSLLPALLAFVTIIYAVLGQNPTLLDEVLAAVWATLPFVGVDAIQRVEPISGSGPVLIASLLISIWGAVGVVRVLQDALNVMWCVPTYRRPGFVIKLVRGLAVLGLVAAAVLATGTITIVTLRASLPLARAIAGASLSIALNVVLITILFRVLTARHLTVGDLWPGAVIAGTSTFLLTLLGGIYVERVVARASAIYGSFATVIGLFAWISLLVQALVLANLVNVVRVERLWPRALTGRHLGEGDARAARLTTRRASIIPEAKPTGATPAKNTDEEDQSHRTPVT